MNVVWIIADTLRRDHIAAYGHPYIRTPAIDALAARSVRFDSHHIASFPTMSARADFATGRWTMSFMGWQPLGPTVQTLAELLRHAGFHTAAVVDTPFYIRGDMNYDRGFESFVFVAGQQPSAQKHHEHADFVARWRTEADRFVARTVTAAMEWLELHYAEDFFLLVDTWDPHEPWDAPEYYTKLYLPEYDGEHVTPVYGDWHAVPGFTEQKLRTAHATYCGEVTLVDTWIDWLLRKLDNTGIADRTIIVFTSDHGFYFGEHGGLFGKTSWAKLADGTLPANDDPSRMFDFSPLYREVATVPLLISVPGGRTGAYHGLSSAIDIMPTVLELVNVEVPATVEGRSLVPALLSENAPGREFVVSSLPFANAMDTSRAVFDITKRLAVGTVATVTTDHWSLIHSDVAGRSELYDYQADPGQERNVIGQNEGTARELHSLFVDFMRGTGVPPHLLEPRLELRL
jgi:arylsulfatase A-like enzyme